MLVPSAVPEDLRSRLARAILCVARGDRDLTPAEAEEFARRVRHLGGDEAHVQEAMRDPDTFPVEPLLDARTRPFGPRVLHDALVVARADGLTDREAKVVARAAMQLRVPPGTVSALRVLLDLEAALRSAEAAVPPEPGSPGERALHTLRQAAEQARNVLLPMPAP